MFFLVLATLRQADYLAHQVQYLVLATLNYLVDVVSINTHKNQSSFAFTMAWNQDSSPIKIRCLSLKNFEKVLVQVLSQGKYKKYI
jgi:hypothetical protein